MSMESGNLIPFVEGQLAVHGNPKSLWVEWRQLISRADLASKVMALPSLPEDIEKLRAHFVTQLLSEEQAPGEDIDVDPPVKFVMGDGPQWSIYLNLKTGKFVSSSVKSEDPLTIIEREISPKVALGIWISEISRALNAPQLEDAYTELLTGADRWDQILVDVATAGPETRARLEIAIASLLSAIGDDEFPDLWKGVAWNSRIGGQLQRHVEEIGREPSDEQLRGAWARLMAFIEQESEPVEGDEI